ncbi:MAG: helicase-related protein [Candidatus Hodarchaeota archaeon]
MADQEKFQPRMYQLNARDQVIDRLENTEQKVFLLLLPTGMGKTFIATMIVEMLIERDLLRSDEKVLFLVHDRKLKHQLYDMAKQYGLANHGYLYLLDEEKVLPAQMMQQHAELAKFLFATPMLLLNAISGKSKRIQRSTLEKIRVVVIDEILDIFAQSYGKKRPRTETIQFIEQKFGQGRTFNQIISDLKQELEASGTISYEIDEQRLGDHVIREFSARNYRLNKKFEPILNLLNLLNPDSDRIVIGLTAALSQDAKIELLKTTFSGSQRVTEIRPIGDDFEDYKPAYRLQRILVFDDWISTIDGLISTIKGKLLKTLHQAYTILTGRPKIPYDRILLFITDLLAKQELQQQLNDKYAGDDQKVSRVLASARAYLLMTVARQRLLESTFPSFRTFIHNITNYILSTNSEFQAIQQAVATREAEKAPDKKQDRLLYWLDRLTQNDQRVLVLCRFVDTTKHLTTIANHHNIPSTNVHGGMSGTMQHARINAFKAGEVKVLFASERLIEKGTDLPQAHTGIYYGTTLSLERYEQSLGRIRSTTHQIKTLYTISYNQTVEDEKSLKRDALFLELIGNKLGTMINT